MVTKEEWKALDKRVEGYEKHLDKKAQADLNAQAMECLEELVRLDKVNLEILDLSYREVIGELDAGEIEARKALENDYDESRPKAWERARSLVERSNEAG